MTDNELVSSTGASEVIGVRQGQFGAKGTGDTSGYGGLVAPIAWPQEHPRPLPDEWEPLAAHLSAGLAASGSSWAQAISRVVVDRGECTLYVHREELLTVAQVLRDHAELRFEVCLGVSGVHYPSDPNHPLHAVYHLTSITHGGRRLRLEVGCSDAEPNIPSLVSVWPGIDWHERETWDMFGIIFSGHPALTRILMPDDWPGHPQRKDYPLGGIPVEYKGAQIPPPDQRRSYN